MNTKGVTNFDVGYEAIEKLKSLTQESTESLREFELGLIQQFLDEESLYIKQIPCVYLYIIIGFF